MEQNSSQHQPKDGLLQVWERIMYVAIGSAIAILFHVREPLRDIILMVTLLYTTLSGFYLLWSLPARESRAKAGFGHLFASWLVALAIFSYSFLPSLGLVFAAYTIFLVVLYWRARTKRSMPEEIFP